MLLAHHSSILFAQHRLCEGGTTAAVTGRLRHVLFVNILSQDIPKLNSAHAMVLLDSDPGVHP